MIQKHLGAAARHAKGFLPFLAPLWAAVKGGGAARAAAAYVADWREYGRLAGEGGEFPLSFAESQPLPYSRYRRGAGKIPRHYFYQDLWAAREIFSSGVPLHHDLGLRIDGFVAHCLCFCRVVVIDIRPLDLPVSGLSFIQGDARDLSAIASGSVASLSSLHALEHVGLGRYGDPLDPRGHRKAAAELCRILAPGGHLYFSTPVGRQRLVFNKHRVFAPATVLEMFRDLDLVSFSAEVERKFHPEARPEEFAGCELACGMFHFRKNGQESDGGRRRPGVRASADRATGS